MKCIVSEDNIDCQGNLDSEAKKIICSNSCKKLYTNPSDALSACPNSSTYNSYLTDDYKKEYNEICGARAAVKISGSLFLITLSTLLIFFI